MDPRIIHLNDLQPENLPNLMQPGEACAIVRNALIYGEGDVLGIDDYLREYIIRGKYDFYGYKSSYYRRDEIEQLVAAVNEQLTEAQAYLLAPLADTGFTRLLLPPWQRSKNDGFWSLDIGTCFGASLEWFHQLLSSTIRRCTNLENLENVLITGENHLAWALANPYGAQTAERLADKPELELPDVKYTPEPWPEPTHWVELKHDLQFPDDIGQTEPAANCPYRLTLPDGSLVNGTLDTNGTARHSAIKPGTCRVEYEPDIDQEIEQLQTEIKQVFDSIVANEQQEYTEIQSKLENPRVLGLDFPGSNAIAQYEMYKKAAATGVWNGVKGIAGFAWSLLKGAGKGLYELSQRLNPLTAPEKFRQDLAAMKAGHEALQQFADEDLETYATLMGDEKTQQLFMEFGKDYIDAQHSLEMTEAGGEAVLDVGLTVVTAGAGAMGSVRHIEKLNRLKPLLQKLMALLKRRRAKQNKSGPHDKVIVSTNQLRVGKDVGMQDNGIVPYSSASILHPGRIAAESGDVSQESIMRVLRQSGSVEGAATAKLIKRRNVNINLVPTDPWKSGAAGRAPFGSNTVYLSLDKLPSPASAAGVAAHETKHVLQKLTPQSYRQIHELQAYQWQRAVDPAFNLSDDAISRFIQTHPLYRNVPPSLTGVQ